MADEVKTTPEAEVVKEPTVGTPTENKEPKVSEVLKEETKESKETVGLDKFLEIKKQNKDKDKIIKDLNKRLEEGDTISTPTDLQELIDEYPDVDPKFLKKMVAVASAQAEKKFEADLKPIKDKEKADRIDTAFKTHFAKALELVPEYKGIVNADLIKDLSLLPKNADKTFVQIIEEAYGNAVGGKRTIETTTPRGGKEPQEIDFAKARKDPAYFKEIMADPVLKKKYNEDLPNRIGF